MNNDKDRFDCLQEDLLDFTIIGASHLADGKTEFLAMVKSDVE